MTMPWDENALISVVHDPYFFVVVVFYQIFLGRNSILYVRYQSLELRYVNKYVQLIINDNLFVSA